MVEILAGADASLIASPAASGTLTLAYGKDMVIWTKRACRRPSLSAASWCSWVTASSPRNMHGTTTPESMCTARPSWSWSTIRDTPRKDPKVFKGGAMTYYGRWAYKIEEAARQGAAGVLLVHDSGAAGYGWNVVQQHLDAARSWNSRRRMAAAAVAAIEGWIQKDAARALFSAAGLDFAASAAAAAHAGFKAIPMGLLDDAMLHNSVRQFTSSNVIALLPGGSRHRNMSCTPRTGTIWAATRALRAQRFQWRGRQCIRSRGTVDCWRSPSCAPSRLRIVPSCFWH